MSVAPNAGIVALDNFTSPTGDVDGQQGQVPKPLAGQQNHILSASGWIPSSTSSGTVTSVAATAGTGINVTGSPITTSGTLVITNTAPDQVVGLTAGTGINVTGTYPNFAIVNTSPSSGGTVTSVSGTGTVNGISLSGTVTSSGNLTLGGALTGVDLTSQVTGVLPVANGGTNASTTNGARSSLGAATSGANTDITSIALTTGTITGTPTSTNDIVNKSYADSIATGVNFHPACQYATTADLGSVTYNNGTSGVGATLTNAGAQAALAIDGHTFTATDVTNATRVLLKNESNAAYNGVYTVTNQGSGSTNWVLTRATDYDTSGSGTNEVDAGDMILVLAGTVNANTSWVQQTPLPITIGTTNITFIQFAAVQTYTAGTGLSLITNQFSITNTGTAGTYGSASAVPVITTNAQGQVTSVTNTSIAISGGAVTGNISGNAANVTGTVAIANGGTGATTRQDAMDALAGATTNGFYLRGNGTDVVMSAIQAADVPTLNQNTTGSAGSVANALTAGTNITFSSGTTYNGSAAITINATGGSGTVTSVSALTLGTTGTDLSSTVANSTTTPVITLNVPTASATNRGALSSSDWSTFNGKQAALVSGTNIKTINSTTLLGSGDIVAGVLAKSTSVFQTGTAATYTAPANTQWVKVTVVGPGGNGGAANNQRATGGGGGGVAIKWLSMTSGQTLTYTVGTASGTASTVSSGTLSITTITANSGTNGTGTAYALSQTAGGAGGTATNGDVNITGEQGGYSYGSSTTVTTNFSGKGGDCPGFGSGGPALAMVATAGVQGNGFGAGGGGAHGSNTAANGRGGVIIFEAY